jgi:purine-binding chemotaxis protein CheW
VTSYTRLLAGGEAYAIPVGYVMEVAGLGDVTAVPGAPPEILGVRNLRGHLLPVIELARLLGIPEAVAPRQLLVAEADGVQAAFAVDKVTDVGELPDRVEEPGSDFLTGAILHDGDLIGVIDMPRLIGSLRTGAEQGRAGE